MVLALGRLGEVGPVDDRAGQISVGAGVTLAALQRAAGGAGWAYGVDIASRDSATVGGTVATNAGGLHVIRYGATRAQVAGLEAVLGTGAVVSHLGGLMKDNTGYDWPGLVCGSEGTLAVVTPGPPPARAPTALPHGGPTGLPLGPRRPRGRRAVPSFAPLAGGLRALPGRGVELVCSVTGTRAPFAVPHPVYLLVEVADRADPTDALAEVSRRRRPRAGRGRRH